MQKARPDRLPVSPPGISHFSFDTLVSEVDAIVEDLRWLHLELSLRNRCNEILFDERAAIPALVDLAFTGLRERLGALELAFLIREGESFTPIVHEIDPSAPWSGDRTPWLEAVDRWIDARPHAAAAPRAEVNHFTVNTVAITSVTMPVRLGAEYVAVVLVVAHSSTVVPRLRKLLTGLSGSLGLAIQYSRNSTGPRGDGAIRTGEAAASPPAPMDAGRTGFPLHVLAHSRGAVVVVLDAALRVLTINTTLAEALGVTPARAVRRSFPELALPEADRERLRALLERRPGIDPGRLHLHFRLRLGDGTSVAHDWISAAMDGGGTPDTPAFLLAGLRSPADTGDAATGGPGIPALPASGSQRGDERFQAARLAKNYRFLMKYVPFPVVHLDAHDDVIRNANPAFAALIGSDHWEGVPLSDFATLQIHAAAGDAVPCTLLVLSPDGITLPTRGIMTSLVLFGKAIREITLDPLDTSL